MNVHVRCAISPLLIALFLLIGGCGQDSKQVVAPPPPDVTVGNPVKQQVTRYLEATGTTAALESVEIRARVQGFLDKILFEPRAQVKAGDLLFIIDPRPFQAKVEQASAAVASRQAAFQLAQVEMDKAQYLVGKAAISELEFLEKKAKRDVARAEVDKAQADLDAARIDLDYTQVKTAISGRVGRNLVDVGNLVGATDKTILTTVVNDQSIYVYFNLSELDLLPVLRDFVKHKRTAGPGESEMRVFMGLADEPGYPREGTIDFADTQVDATTGTLQVRAIFPNADGLLLQGMFVRVRVPVETKEAVLVPDVALLTDQGGKYVLVVDDQNVVSQRRVKTGQQVERLRVIEEGLATSDRVVVNGVQRARPGSKVNPIRSEAATPAPPASESAKSRQK